MQREFFFSLNYFLLRNINSSKFLIMEEIIKSSLLEYDKSTFLIDLIKHGTGTNYIKIQQSIKGKSQYQELKINSSILNDLIFVLQSYQKEIPKPVSKSSISYFSDDKQEDIIRCYFKGITIKNLTLIFDCSQKNIEQILINKGIPIVDNNPPKIKERYRFRSKK